MSQGEQNLAGGKGPCLGCASWALWISLFQVIYTVSLGFFTMYIRYKNVDAKILKEKFGEEHKKFNITPAKLAYPDQGNGYYSRALPYQNWFKWNSAMRAHQHAVEYLPIALIATLANWFFCPTAGAWVAALTLAIRFFHTFTYFNNINKAEFANTTVQLVSGASILWAIAQSF